ncbi:NAD-dependent protein deacetylase [Cellulomonas gelida]|uniref:NAD-dependent protein deacetylase n=1 Tax=Cellulomonas gelida TaxID=1712 RepID=A0A4Y3KLF4_9CELL|nr:NAD-dependent protein deacetylase [Cellulomonas gelida]GGL38288.1 NAD-dependent protein deacetylase [Cellulomonas gelida]
MHRIRVHAEVSGPPRTGQRSTPADPREQAYRGEVSTDARQVTTASLGDVVDALAGHRLTVLTGAGVSTDSGIPDYRGPDSPPRTPMTFQQFVGDEAFRRHYWARNHVGWRHVNRTLPNKGHQALVALEQRGVVLGIITQNVDLLHEAAGSRHVIDLHGRYDRVVCLECGTVIGRRELADRLDALNPGFADEIGAVADVEIAPDADAVIEATSHFVAADCARCGGMLKPDIVYFGETVPRERVERAYALVDAGDALLVAGSSLTVQSGLRFVRHAAQAGKPVVVVNRGATRGDRYAVVTLDAGTSETLTELAEVLPAPRASG